jgi:hypothetical protein
MASIVTLKTGQNIICEVNEIFQGEQEDKRGVGLQLKDPFILELHENPEAENPDDRNRVKFARWNPFTLERVFRVSYDAVVAVSAPDPNLDSAFADKVEYFNSIDIVDDIPVNEPNDIAIETEE